MNKKLFNNLDEMYFYIGELKKHNRRLFSNQILSEEVLEKEIQKNNLYFCYSPQKYLNILIYERDFVRLYYYIADIDNYEISELQEKIVCDVFFSKRDEKVEQILKTLGRCGLKQYATFSKWCRKADDFRETYVDYEGYTISPKTEPNFGTMLEEYFESYTDMIPNTDEMETYLSDKICYSAKNKFNQTIGGIVITQRGSVQTEEFLFVDPVYRGKSIAKRLHEEVYKNSDDTIKQFVCWIRDDNMPSINVHKYFGYEKANAYKITMMKG